METTMTKPGDASKMTKTTTTKSGDASKTGGKKFDTKNSSKSSGKTNDGPKMKTMDASKSGEPDAKLKIAGKPATNLVNMNAEWNAAIDAGRPFNITTADGQVVKVDPGNDWSKAHSKSIATSLTKNIPFEDAQRTADRIHGKAGDPTSQEQANKRQAILKTQVFAERANNAAQGQPATD